mgnify:CR=1 FL=1
MRNDIRQGAKIFVDNNVKPNYAALARQYNVDYRTAKRAYLEAKAELTVAPVSRKSRPSLLDDFKEIIEAKLELNCSIMSIFKFIQKRGFTGQYTIVKDYCRTLKAERVHMPTPLPLFAALYKNISAYSKFPAYRDILFSRSIPQHNAFPQAYPHF